MAAEKGKEVTPPVVLINALEDLKNKLKSGGASPELEREFAELKQKFETSATVAREGGDKKLSQAFVEHVSPLIKNIESELLKANKVHTFPASTNRKWQGIAGGHNVVSEKEVHRSESPKTSAAKSPTAESPTAGSPPAKPSFRMGSRGSSR